LLSGGATPREPAPDWCPDARSSMGFVPENQDRPRLPAGGKRIRTPGPSRNPAGLSGGTGGVAGGEKGSLERVVYLRGTEGSNPLPSATESVSPVPSGAAGSEPRVGGGHAWAGTCERDGRSRTGLGIGGILGLSFLIVLLIVAAARPSWRLLMLGCVVGRTERKAPICDGNSRRASYRSSFHES
jgi:hypothetical protein